MSNATADARGTELEIRKKLIESGAVDVMISIGSNFFYTVTLPCTLWFLDRGKTGPSHGGTNKGGRASPAPTLFIDARQTFTQIDRAHREFTEEQIQFLANIVRLYREEPLAAFVDPETKKHFPKGKYKDVPGLCKVATIKEIEAQGWSLNPGRYVGVTERAADDFDFKERLEELNEELETLNAEARELEERIAENVAQLLDE